MDETLCLRPSDIISVPHSKRTRSFREDRSLKNLQNITQIYRYYIEPIHAKLAELRYMLTQWTDHYFREMCSCWCICCCPAWDGYCICSSFPISNRFPSRYPEARTGRQPTETRRDITASIARRYTPRTRTYWPRLEIRTKIGRLKQQHKFVRSSSWSGQHVDFSFFP